MRFATDATGPVWNVTMIFAVLPARRRDLSLALEGFGRDSPFAAARSVHMARLAVLDAVPARGLPPPATVPVSPARLLFGASVDGGMTVLVDELLPARAEALGIVFRCCAGFPGVSDPAGFTAWLHDHRLAAAISFATVAAPALHVRRALQRRERLSALVARGASLAPAELRRAFRDVVGA